ncbi:uncharacterized protein LOC129948020 [Eupeodes corollae]|uniref:uncharacterized protein LOC129948020 n=1 Tax=Eupeodes corollae TaxID=290404 RepID=UPI00248FF0AD|nr:uncharacterized protein LOC129948020 [Eupeodes corollae]
MTHNLFLLFTLLSTLEQIESLCNVCQKNYAACLDEKRFALCTGGKPEDKIYTCPDGYVCTKSTSVCLPQSEMNPVTASCEMTCGLCNSPGKLFSCLSSSTYAFCFAKDVPDLTAKGVCPDGYVCNLKSREICMKATEDVPSCNAVWDENDSITTSGTTEIDVTTFKPKVTTSQWETKNEEDDATVGVTSPEITTEVSCPTESTLSTTQATEYESNFCNLIQSEGLYRSEGDTTCQKFVLCYFLAGQFLELQYSCSSTDFFNEKTKNCETEKPIDCL